MDEARKTVTQLKLAFPVACQLDCYQTAEITGSFYDEKGKFLHATGFIIRPVGTVEAAVYSTGPIGRFTASDCISLIDYKVKNP